MCPECGADEAWTLSTGRDDEGRVVRKRQCRQCGVEFVTLEVVVPVTFARLDVRGKDENRARQRRKRGYKGTHHSISDPPDVRVKIQISDTKNKRRIPECGHPEAEYVARGKCAACYQRWWYNKTKPTREEDADGVQEGHPRYSRYTTNPRRQLAAREDRGSTDSRRGRVPGARYPQAPGSPGGPDEPGAAGLPGPRASGSEIDEAGDDDH